MWNTKIFSCMLGVLFIAHLQVLNAQTFRHPGGLVTQDDIDRILFLLDSEKDPTIIAAFNKLKSNNHAQYTYNPNPQVRVVRGSSTYPENYMTAANDVAAAYQNALMWRISGDTKYADCAVKILNSWAALCVDIAGDTNASLASGIYGYEFAQAGELLRGYSGWKAADFKAYQSWMRNLWYPRAIYFLEGRHGHAIKDSDPGAYFSNWGLCNLLCVMSVGVLCDDVFIYNQGLSYYKDDKAGTFTDVARNPILDLGYNEFLGNLVVWLHPDKRGPLGYLGQMQESGRDQGHATMAAELATDICQTAWNQGDDLYAYMNNRIMAGIEYIALVNSLNSDMQVADSVPFIPYARSGFPTENYTATQNGLTGWGSARPMWDRVIAHFEGEKGIPMNYSRKMVAKTGVDGGGGDYGGNSGGFDQLGFTTLTNYRPTSLYPSSGHFSITLGTSITYKSIVYQASTLSAIESGNAITLTPSLPNGVTDSGKWSWETGEKTREITFTATKSGIYRVFYTSENGTKSTQAFSIAVKGDCTPDIITPFIAISGGVNTQTSIATVLPYQAFTLSIQLKDYYYYGTTVWCNGSTGPSVTISNGIRSDSVFWVDHYNFGGYKTRIYFKIKSRYVIPSISVNGAVATATSSVSIEKGQTVEFRPVTTIGFDAGTFLWSTGHTSKNLVILNVRKPQHLQVYYTLTKKGITTIDTLEFYVSTVNNNYQLKNGDYYFQNASDNTYLTNTNANATTKVKPTFAAKVVSSDSISQIWTITKETATDANGRFKMVSKKDGNYVNEKGAFGTNPYYSSWNTYTFHTLEGQNLFAIQNGGNSGTTFWTIAGTSIAEGTNTQSGFPFLIRPIIPQSPDTTTIAGQNVLSYIYPMYGVNGLASQFGDSIVLTPGMSVVLRPTKVSGISAGTWLWGDNRTNSTLSFPNIIHGGIYNVSLTYSENIKTYKFPLKYTITIAEDSVLLKAGTYKIRRATDGKFLTNIGSLNPTFAALVADTLTQEWIVSKDETTGRNKIVSAKDSRFLNQHGKFTTSVYAAAYNSYLLHYYDQGERLFAVQNAGSADSTYWAIEGDIINDVNHTVRINPFKFDLVRLTTGIKNVNMTDVYLNPVTDILYLKFADTAGNAQLELFTIEGKKVKMFDCNPGENSIDLSQLREGLFVGIIHTTSKDYYFKIIKK